MRFMTSQAVSIIHRLVSGWTVNQLIPVMTEKAELFPLFAQLKLEITFVRIVTSVASGVRIQRFVAMGELELLLFILVTDCALGRPGSGNFSPVC